MSFRIDDIEAKMCQYREEGFPKIWVSDQGDGTFINPIIHADYSDPDVIKVGDDFFMVASSFNATPGFPILHSKDLVNWKIVSYIIEKVPFDAYDKPLHGQAVWAPSIRFHDGYYWVYVGMPDEGIFMSRTRDPFGQWEPMHCVKEARGWIDTCPFWDDDGQAYLVNGFAKSRIGFKSVLGISKMAPDGRSLTDEFRIVIDGNIHHPTVEGPKMYKRNGYYYISAPAGGVAVGYQLVLRSKHVYGPYEEKVVLHQGDSIINGPHQGGWVDINEDESWFIHFQDKGAYGRIVHMQPMRWVDDWPVIGVDSNNDGIGEPVLRYKKPSINQKEPIEVPVTSDDFDSDELGLQWQWSANYNTNWYKHDPKNSSITLYSQWIEEAKEKGMYAVPNMLLQKFPAYKFEVTAKLDLSKIGEKDYSGFIVMGMAYCGIFVHRDKDVTRLCRIEGNGPEGIEKVIVMAKLGSEVDLSQFYIHMNVSADAMVDFSYGYLNGDGKEIVEAIETPFQAVKGRWVGAKYGLLTVNYEQDTHGEMACDYVLVREV